MVDGPPFSRLWFGFQLEPSLLRRWADDKKLTDMIS